MLLNKNLTNVKESHKFFLELLKIIMFFSVEAITQARKTYKFFQIGYEYDEGDFGGQPCAIVFLERAKAAGCQQNGILRDKLKYFIPFTIYI